MQHQTRKTSLSRFASILSLLLLLILLKICQSEAQVLSLSQIQLQIDTYNNLVSKYLAADAQAWLDAIHREEEANGKAIDGGDGGTCYRMESGRQEWLVIYTFMYTHFYH